jgi:cell division protease FtsH
MSDAVGPVYLGTGEKHVFLGREIVRTRPYSDATAQRLDGAIRQIVEDSLEEALRVVRANTDKLEALVSVLLEKETLDAVQVTEILGPRPASPDNVIKTETPIDAMPEAMGVA